MTRDRQTTVWFDQRLRAQWPRPLAEDWHRLYPQLFDDDDLRITRRQPQKHFYEWLVAMHLFHATGALSLVEKYLFEGAHSRKSAVIHRLLTPQELRFLNGLGNQPPDLLVYKPTLDHYWFVEVKGPADRVRPVQARTHRAITKQLGVGVEVVACRASRSGRTSA